MKRCTACGQSLPLHMFSPHPAGVGGKQSKCRDCLALAMAVSFYRRFKDSPEFWRLVEAQGVHHRTRIAVEVTA